MKPTKNTLFNILTVMALTLSLAFVACEGPAGPDGAQGPQGEAGVVGPAGDDGSVMYAGEGAPTADIGVNGDFYLNQTTGELYGPKDENEWGTPISLQGPPGDDGDDGTDGNDGTDGQDGADGDDGVDGQDGADGQAGADGNTIHSGTTTPAASLGSAGDFYLNTATFDLYGPKTDSGWGTPINLKGTANVLYSSWINIDWNVEDGLSRKTMSIPESRLTDEFLDTGVLKMYIKQEAENDSIRLKAVFPLPGNLGSRYVYFYATSYTGDIPDDDFPADFKGIFLNSDGELPIGFDQVRYVLIPGGEQLSAKGKIDLDDYEQVKKYFGLQQ